jgi:hypothetical protein
MYFDDHVPEYQAATVRLFEKFQTGELKPFISSIVFDEVIRAPGLRQDQIKKLIGKFDIVSIDIPINQVDILAEEYIRRGLLSKKHWRDLQHIAIATLAKMDIVFSFNFKHLVRSKTKIESTMINGELGYGSLIIMSPTELFTNEYQYKNE